MHIPSLIAATSPLVHGPQSPLQSLQRGCDVLIWRSLPSYGKRDLRDGERGRRDLCLVLDLVSFSWGRPLALEAAELKTPKNMGGEEPMPSVGSRRGAFAWLGGKQWVDLQQNPGKLPCWEMGRRGGWLLNWGAGRQGVSFRVSMPFFSIPELVLEVGVN